MARLISIAIAAALLASAASAAEVYRSVGSDGTVSYSDRPVGDNPEPITIVTPHPASVPPAPPPAEPEPAAAAAPDSNGAPEPAAPTREELAAERAANCAAAKEKNDRYQMSRRLYRTLPNGEREYLSDEELDAAKAGAAADVEKWCN